MYETYYIQIITRNTKKDGKNLRIHSHTHTQTNLNLNKYITKKEYFFRNTGEYWNLAKFSFGKDLYPIDVLINIILITKI